ncbi:MAG: DNA gyrase/topoisomerase IV subunit A [Cytophagales bacterium]|nr:DNA gyrase/topoisomerase IV subunit A [Cytophagales bacterium]
MNEDYNEHEEEFEAVEEGEVIHDIVPVSGMYENWFLEYASYVILERAVPSLEDGLKPVQRRILHSMKEKDDGRYNKVANIIGHTMQYHPHGDAAIGEAIVHLGQKDLLIDMQGNWGDIRTGDRAAAARYIEARLSKFANHVLFNPKLTTWQLSYDGRNNEPINLPVKFPLLLAQGVDGIAVGLATKIMPHNFIELVDASIKILKGRKPKVYPDFPTGGIADFSNYNDGLKGGKVRVRAIIEVIDKKTLAVRQIPFTTTTTSIIESILKANDAGKIKVRQVIDNTAQDVEILITLPNGVSPDVTIGALYAFTNCEVSISPNACVIVEDKPQFLGVSEILRLCTKNTISLLTRELEIERDALKEKLLFASLEQIFIQEEMYIDFKFYDNKEKLFVYLEKRFEPFKEQFYREITEEDYERLTRIPMIRITRFDNDVANDKMRGLQDSLKETEHHLANIIDYAIAYFQEIKEKFGKGKERKTEIATFENISATAVAASNAKLYVNKKEGFIGTGLKKDEFVCECSDIDDIIAFRSDGRFVVTKIADKTFVGKNILHVGVFKKKDERMVYNTIYLDGNTEITMAKRFQVLSVARDKEYEFIKTHKKSKVMYFSANPNGEAETLTFSLSPACSAKNKVFDYTFADLLIKNKGALGNRVTKYPVKKVQFKEAGFSTLSGLKLWYDKTIGRLNTEDMGELLGEFNNDDTILVVYDTGEYELTGYDLTNRYDAKRIVLIEKFDPNTVVSVAYYDGGNKRHYVKRFQIETTSLNKKFLFITDHSASRLEVVSTLKDPRIAVTYRTKARGGEKLDVAYSIVALIGVKGWKVLGNRIPHDYVSTVKLQDPLPEEEIEEAKVIETTETKTEEVQETPPPSPKPDENSSLEDMF